MMAAVVTLEGRVVVARAFLPAPISNDRFKTLNSAFLKAGSCSQYYRSDAASQARAR